MSAERDLRLNRTEQGLLAEMYRAEHDEGKRSLMFKHMLRLIEREKELVGFLERVGVLEPTKQQSSEYPPVAYGGGPFEAKRL